MTRGWIVVVPQDLGAMVGGGRGPEGRYFEQDCGAGKGAHRNLQ